MIFSSSLMKDYRFIISDPNGIGWSTTIKVSSLDLALEIASMAAENFKPCSWFTGIKIFDRNSDQPRPVAVVKFQNGKLVII